MKKLRESGCLVRREGPRKTRYLDCLLVGLFRRARACQCQVSTALYRRMSVDFVRPRPCRVCRAPDVAVGPGRTVGAARVFIQTILLRVASGDMPKGVAAPWAQPQAQTAASGLSESVAAPEL